jgi:hypothetical protein
MRFLSKGRAVSSLVMIAIIVVAIIALPVVLSFAGMRAGFVDIGESITLPSAPKADLYSNSEFLPCRSVNGSPCPEGTFCDGATKGCVNIAKAGV